MLKRILLWLLLGLVALAAVKLWLWEKASTPSRTTPAYGHMPADEGARQKRY